MRYAKRGRMRFASHRDFSRAFERAIFRARIPMAYSSGFNPHPRISYAGAAPTGAASEAEYLEIGLAERLTTDQAAAALAETMPPGLDVVAVAESPGGSLADLLSASHWSVVVDTPLEQTRAAVAAFLAQDTVLVTRMTKKGEREFDCRQPIVRLTTRADDSDIAERSTIDLVLRHAVPAVRPDDVLTGLRQMADLTLTVRLTTRLAQGVLDEDREVVVDPFGPEDPGSPDAP